MAPQSRRSWWWIIGLAKKAVHDLRPESSCSGICSRLMPTMDKAPVMLQSKLEELNIGIHLNKATQYIDGAESITE
jgi:nitrite reductase (NADH) large subunit